MYLSLRLIVFFLCNCRVIKQVDYILLILQRVFYSDSELEQTRFGLNDRGAQTLRAVRIVVSIFSGVVKGVKRLSGLLSRLSGSPHCS